MASLEDAFDSVRRKFGIESLNNHQKEAIKVIVEERRDLFVNLPTGFGKSLIYQALPTVFNFTKQDNNEHIVVVVSRLVSLMNDQVAYLNSVGIKSINLSCVDEQDQLAVVKGKYSIVYGSPESWLKNERWRSMLSSDVYSKRLCAVAIDEAHVIRQWGVSQDKKMAAFRDSYSKLYEFRSLAPDVPVIALTATATKLTKEAIVNLLHMKNIHEIKETANKLNIAYSVKYLDKDTELECYFDWLADELKEKNVNTQRTIIYCQTIRQCAFLYGILKAMMGDDMFVGDCRKDALIEMLHSCTPQTNKENILHSFQLETGTIRLLIATIAFGMGVNCKGVHRVIHFGPSKTVESYVQETGRAGRDGKQSVAYLLYNGVMLSHVDSQMKQFIDTTECRRKNLLMHFEDNTDVPEETHLCCDNCAAKYESGVPHVTSYPASTLDDSTDTLTSSTKRQVSQEQVDTVKKELTKYHKSIIIQLVGSSANGNIKTLTDPKFMLGSSVQQISQVLYNLNKIFSMQDIYKFVEIWDRKHAVFIHSVIANVFGDVDHNSAVQNLHVFNVPGDVEFNEDLLDEWHDILEDDELYEMVIENLSLSQMQNSTLEDETDLGTDEFPPAIVSTVQNMTLHSL